MTTQQNPAARSMPRLDNGFQRALPLLLKREYWEHRGGFLWTPVWMTASILILTVLAFISAEVLGANTHVHVGFSLDELRAHISENDMAKAGNLLDIGQLMFSGLASIGLFFVLFFYLLGALYDDRRDRSVLFWKSLPVTDSATVVSKALSATLVAPVIAFVIASAAYFVFLVIVTLWFGLHGMNALPAVMAAHPLGVFLRLMLTVPVSALWALPAVGWLLFWSAYVRSKPFLWAVLVPFLALFANWWLGKLGAPHIASDVNLGAIVLRLLISIMPGSWMKAEGAGVIGSHIRSAMDPDHVVGAFDPSNVYGLLAEPNLWIGVLAGIVLLVAATWYRQRRIETAT